MRRILEVTNWQLVVANENPAPPGASLHELGTARMGHGAAEAVLDPNGRSWDVDNLFVADGAAFPSGGYQHPTLTILALASRTAAFVAAEFAAGRYAR
jgi:choline dehydrogenase-like flavoprotein